MKLGSCNKPQKQNDEVPNWKVWNLWDKERSRLVKLNFEVNLYFLYQQNHLFYS
jgi:hypothetical protein